MGRLLPLDIPPGVVLDQTEYQSGKPTVRWRAADKCRWYGRQIGPIGGWRTRTTHLVTGAARAIVTWRSTGSSRWIAIGTHSHLYAQAPDGTVSDVTPLAFVSGQQDETANTGFGQGTFGSGPFGVARPDTGLNTPASVWDFDIFQGILVGCFAPDGRILEWDNNTGAVAVAVTNAPTGCAGVFVTDEGFVMAGGAGGDLRKVQWSDQNARTVWTPSSTNQAGAIDLFTSGQFLRGVCLGQESLILTDLDAHVCRYVGLPYVYNFNRVATACGGYSKRCIAALDERAIWWSKSGFKMYVGGSVQPVPCPLWDYLTNNLNPGQTSKITAHHNAAFGEIWWDYPSLASIENDSYVFYAYRLSEELGLPVWGYGSRSRTCAVGPSVFRYPMACDLAGNTYEHEVEFDYGGAVPTARTGPVELGAGDQIMAVLGAISDDKTAGDAQLRLRGRILPDGAETVGAWTAVTANARTDMRLAARQVALEAQFFGGDAARLGMVRLDVMPMGRR